MALFGWMGNVHLVDLVGFWEIDGLVGVGKLRPVALRSQETTALGGFNPVSHNNDFTLRGSKGMVVIIILYGIYGIYSYLSKFYNHSLPYSCARIQL